MLRDFPSLMIIQLHPRVPDPNTAKRLIGNMLSLLQEAGMLARRYSQQWEILYWNLCHIQAILINHSVYKSVSEFFLGPLLTMLLPSVLHRSVLHFFLRLDWHFLRVQIYWQKNAEISKDSGPAPSAYSGRTTYRRGHHGNKAVNNDLCFTDTDDVDLSPRSVFIVEQ